ncbi:MAG: magnesium transporter, partial [Pseudomonadota bacterium]
MEAEAREKPILSEVSADAAVIYDDNGAIRADFIDQVSTCIAEQDAERLLKSVTGLHESELGDLIEALEPGQR